MSERFRVEGITKTFGLTVANNKVSLSIKAGSVHGLAGENGSGKSTLASIICGMKKPDSGKMYKDGAEYTPSSPTDANDKKVAMVVQELGIIGDLSPAVNMFLGKTDRFAKYGIIDTKKITEEAEKQFEIHKLPRIPLNGLTASLSIEQRKILELARALSAEPELLILDEISQALSQDNRNMLYSFIKEFTAKGNSILMITHDLDEMLEVCDTISVLRDGVVIETKPSADYTIPALQKAMIGRDVEGNYYRQDHAENYEETRVLKVENLACRDLIKNVNFELHKGEILGVCGLSDAGIHDIGRVMFGLEDGTTGYVTDLATGKNLKTPQDVINAGGAYLSKDRDSDGLMLRATVAQNLIVPNSKRLSGKAGLLKPSDTKAMAQNAADSYEIKCEGINSIIGQLSGGNKQKVNLSRWLVQDLKFIILDCPTRGVDVGVKAYIYGILLEAKKKGMGILMITDELAEAMNMADRILVMREHEQVAMLNRSTDFQAEKVAEAML